MYRNYKLRIFNEILTRAQLETKELNEKLNLAYEELTEKNDELTKLSNTDKLTELKNRRKLDELFDIELKRTKRYETVFSIILLDIDHFKAVNDNHGHLAGDEVLKDIAKIIKVNIRNTDTGGRWGGEEFLVLCPSVDLSGVANLAEKLRTAVEQHTFFNGIKITASFGIAVVQENDDIDKIIARADNAVYEAKKNGRNRVVS